MSNISFSSPFLRSFVHSISTVGTASTTILAVAEIPTRRVSVIIQNQHATAMITVILSASASIGLQVKAGESISLDNYNGVVRCVSDTASTPVHVAYSVC